MLSHPGVEAFGEICHDDEASCWVVAARSAARCATLSGVAIDHRMVHFRSADFSEVCDEIRGIEKRANGREWITVSPWVDAENLPVKSLLHRIFSARGSKVPEATWVPEIDGEPAQLGFMHAQGPGALPRLVEAGVDIPEGFVKVGDHSKRGLLFGLRPETTAEAIVSFVLAASEVLAEVPTDDRWIAQVSTSED